MIIKTDTKNIRKNENKAKEKNGKWVGKISWSKREGNNLGAHNKTFNLMIIKNVSKNLRLRKKNTKIK